MEELFKNHKVLFTIHPYGHGIPCPCCAKRTQKESHPAGLPPLYLTPVFQPGILPTTQNAKRTQFPARGTRY